MDEVRLLAAAAAARPGAGETRALMKLMGARVLGLLPETKTVSRNMKSVEDEPGLVVWLATHFDRGEEKGGVGRSKICSPKGGA